MLNSSGHMLTQWSTTWLGALQFGQVHQPELAKKNRCQQRLRYSCEHASLIVGWPTRNSSQQMLHDPVGSSNAIRGMVRCRGMEVKACAIVCAVARSERDVKVLSLSSSSSLWFVVVGGCCCCGRGVGRCACCRSADESCQMSGMPSYCESSVTFAVADAVLDLIHDADLPDPRTNDSPDTFGAGRRGLAPRPRPRSCRRRSLMRDACTQLSSRRLGAIAWDPWDPLELPTPPVMPPAALTAFPPTASPSPPPSSLASASTVTVALPICCSAAVYVGAGGGGGGGARVGGGGGVGMRRLADAPNAAAHGSGCDSHGSGYGAGTSGPSSKPYEGVGDGGTSADAPVA